jgi:hypothetical protein
MNDQISNGMRKGSWILALAVMALVGISCNDEFGGNSQFATAPEVSATANAEMVVAAQEVLDITGAGMSSQGIAYGRAAAHEGNDDWDKNRLCGATISKNFDLDNSMPDSLILSGSITIDFGDGTNCPDSANRHHSGKITTEFTINVNLKNHLFSSSETVTLDEFTRGSKTLSGVFHAQAASGGMRWLDITNAQLTYTPKDNDENGDGDDENSTPTTISWSGSLTFMYDNNETLTRSDDTKTITGTITGTTDAGVFTSEIAEALTIKSSCFNGRNIPVSGIVNITSAGVLTVVDFGDGTCDKLYTSTTGDETIELHL